MPTNDAQERMENTTLREAATGAVVGFLVAACFLAVLGTIHAKLPFRIPCPWAALPVFPVLAGGGAAVAARIGRRTPLVAETARFLLVGVLNTLVDLGILDLLMLATGHMEGAWFTLFKALSFLAAVVNSYLWNKHWTFGRRRTRRRTPGEFLVFFAVSAAGFALNVGTASLLVNVVGPRFGLGRELWANACAAAAAVMTIGWNFTGYKLVVFKSRSRLAGG